MHTRQSTAKAGNDRYAGTLCATKRKKRSYQENWITVKAIK